MQILSFVCIGLVASYIELAGSTDCYVCYSWKDPGCDEYYISSNVNLTTCGVPPRSPSSFWSGSSGTTGDRDREREREQREREDRTYLLNAPPSTCVKEVITFIDPPIRSQNDRYNRFSRPWVERKCGNTIQAGYRSGRDLVDDCEDIEVTIEGVAGIKRTCFCSTDGCNSGTSVTLNAFLLSVATFACLLKSLTC